MTGRILIAETASNQRIVLSASLAAARYAVEATGCPHELLARVREAPPDLILMGARFSDGGAPSMIEMLKDDPATRQVPVVVLTSPQSRDRAGEMLDAGAEECLPRSLPDAGLMAALRSVMRRRAALAEIARHHGALPDAAIAGMSEPGAEWTGPRTTLRRATRIGLIAESPATGLLWRRALRDCFRGDIVTLSPAHALDHVVQPGRPCDAYVLASDLEAEGDGLRLVPELRSRDETRDAVIVVQDAGLDPAAFAMAFDLGANAVCLGRFDAGEVAARLRALLKRRHETERHRAAVETRLEQALRDPLTGLHNRRYGEAELASIYHRSIRSAEPFAVVIADLDNFKSVNDRFGHLTGDVVLREAAARLRAALREGDMIARYGGEEFLIVLPGAGPREVRAICERLRRAMAERPVRAGSQGAEPADVAVTVSLGAALADGVSTPPVGQLVERADRALYASKSGGRDKVTYAGARNVA